MPTFRRVRIHATVETESMLLKEDEIDDALSELRRKLAGLDLSVVSIGPDEPPSASATSSFEWSDRTP